MNRINSTHIYIEIVKLKAAFILFYLVTENNTTK